MPRTLQELSPWLTRAAPLLYRQLTLVPDVSALKAVLAEHPRLLIVLNHGPMLGPVPAAVALGQAALSGGGAERVPFGIAWRGFYRLPLVRQLAGRLTRAEKELNVFDAVARLKEGPWTDCVIMPEGELCNLGNGVDVQPFRSGRFIEVAVRAGVPILMVAHLGTEQLARPLEVPRLNGALSRWLPSHLQQPLARSGMVSLPWLLDGRIDQLRMTFALHQPALTQEVIDSPQGPRAVSREAQQVRAGLQRLVNQLVVTAEDGEGLQASR